MLPISARHRPLCDGSELLVGQRNIAGDTDPGVARFDELETVRCVAYRLRRRPARLQSCVVQPGLHQNEFVAAAEFGQLAGQKPYPRQRARVAGERTCHRLVKTRQGGPVGREVNLPILDPRAEQGQCSEQPARARIFRKLAEKGLRVDHSLDQGFELARLKEEQPLPFQERGRVRAAHRQEMRAVAGQSRGKLSGGFFSLLGLLRVDDRDQKVLELRKQLLEHFGALPPRQAGREHLIGIGIQRQVVRHVEAGEHGKRQPGQEARHRVAMTALDQAGEQTPGTHQGAPRPSRRRRFIGKGRRSSFASGPTGLVRPPPGAHETPSAGPPHG